MDRVDQRNRRRLTHIVEVSSPTSVAIGDRRGPAHIAGEDLVACVPVGGDQGKKLLVRQMGKGLTPDSFYLEPKPCVVVAPLIRQAIEELGRDLVAGRVDTSRSARGHAYPTSD